MITQPSLFGGTARLINWVNEVPERLCKWECDSCGYDGWSVYWDPVPEVCPKCGKFLTGGKSYKQIAEESDERWRKWLEEHE